MDKELSTTPADHQRGFKAGHGDYSQQSAGKPGRRQKKRPRSPEPLELLLKTVRHFFPAFSHKINGLHDPRNVKQCVYEQSHLIWMGVLMYLEQLGSRRQIRYERESDIFVENFGELCGQKGLGYVADPDTLAYYAERLSVKEAESLSIYLIQRLIRMKALDAFRLYGYLPVAVDGSRMFRFADKPFDSCCHKKLSNGETEYFSSVLDAKIVTPSGLSLTIASEMLSNEGNSEFDKQDCELKAFPRLASKIQAAFPRTPFVFLFDGLYASQNVIRLMKQNNWRYFITFKEGSMPERYAETLALAKLQHDNTLVVEKERIRQDFTWVSELPIAEFTPNVIFCLDSDESEEEKTQFVWLTDFKVTSANVAELSNKGGRLRWKIENEGFKVQKKNGYKMEHAYSRHENGIKIMYILLTIAHIINQLILKGSLIRSLMKTFGSAKNFARRLSESMRCNKLNADALKLPGQIRLVQKSGAGPP